jgi:hypothetical protein
MHPLVVGAKPRVLAGCDDRTAAGADLAPGVRLVVIPLVSRLVLVGYRVCLFGAAEVFQQSLFDFVASEVWRRCHVDLLRV